MRLRVMCWLVAVFGMNGHAADGVLEINQVCALNGGCFAGDSAGFPVTIDGSAGVSYRLTGSLDLSSVPGTTAIDIDGPYITLDLNGFEIRGPITCTGSGPTLDCGVVGTGDGVALSANADFVTIRNGTIRNMARHGVGASGNELRVTDVTARHNARDGLNGGTNSLAINCIAHENGNDGFQFGSGSVIQQSAAFGNGEDGIRIENSNGVIDNSTARNNGLQGFEMGHSSRFGKNASTGNGAADSCGGGVCSEKKRFYLTKTAVDGDEVLDQCADGFHLASQYELLDWSSWQYDYVLGDTSTQDGRGPPWSFAGWIWRGGTSNSVTCLDWTDDWELINGPITKLHGTANMADPAEVISPWVYDFDSCDSTYRVWCAED